MHMGRPRRYHYKSIFAVKDGPFLSDRVASFPLDLGPAEVLEYLVDLHGEPVDAAVTETEEFGRVDIGWVFPGPNDDEGRPLELIVIPMIENPDDADHLISMFVYQEQLRRDFVSTMTEAGIDVQVVNAT
jgi:hypothetical protein